MQGARPVVQWVSDSAVRSELIHTLAGEPHRTDQLLAVTEASESAVYAGLNELQRRGLLNECDVGWETTGRGRLVADLLSQRTAVEQLFDGDDQYWETHDVSVLPPPFRLRLGALAEYEMVSISRTDPQRVVRTVTDALETAEWAWILAPIYRDEYGTAMPDTEESRLVLDRAVIEDALSSIEEPETERPEHAEVRIGEAPLGLTLTPSTLLLSFPTLDGQYDTQTHLLVESEAAMQWGRDVFEHYWEAALPVPAE